MKVGNIMNPHVESVSVDTSLINVARLIFGKNINGVCVVEGKKLVGFISERDILSKFYPSMNEYIDDPFGAGDFEAMEGKINEVLELKAKDIMSRDPVTITGDQPVLRAQSLMFIHKIGRLPVVDDEENLLGIISKGDIFRSVVGDRLPFEQDEKFHDWLSRRYDVIVDWKKRLSRELPDLIHEFKKNKVRTVLDIGCGTGMHAIALAKEGFKVVAIDISERMIFQAEENSSKEPDSVKKNVQFIRSEYKNLDALFKEKFDSAIIMGNGLSHNHNPDQVVKEVGKILGKPSLVVIQLANFEKIFTENKRLLDFSVRRSPLKEEREQAFLRFYDPKEDGFLTQNVSVFARRKKHWSFKGIHAMSIFPLNMEKITHMLEKIGFPNDKIEYYGGEEGFYYDYLLKKPFHPKHSDVLVVLAKR